MAEQTFSQAVRESRIFFRRTLVEKLMIAGQFPNQAVMLANQATRALTLLEEGESMNSPSGTCEACGHDAGEHQACGHPTCSCCQFINTEG